MLVLKNKKASILIYTIVLTIISLLLATVLLSNKMSLFSNQNYYYINNKFLNQIKSNSTLSFNYLIKTNSDGNGFIDSLSGSGDNIYCRLQGDGSYLLEGDNGVENATDGFDDNCNSDNFLGNNTGSIDYLSGFEDNDNIARKNLIGIIVPGQQKNIFWNNKKIDEFIEENTNNIDEFNKTLSGVSDGNLYLNLNTGALLTLIEFDKNRFDDFGEIREISSFTGTINGKGYIDNNSDILKLSSSTGADTISFNFTNSGYLLFLTNTGSNLINYSLSGYENTGSGIYLNPINDDINNTGAIEILGYDVIINSEGNIFGKMSKKVFEK